MTPTVEIKPLSQNKRRIVFALSLLLFVCAVPVSVFYAIGYRFDFTDDITNIKSVGGMYVRSDAANTEMFINDEPVRDMRVFQKAAYIQNLEAGMHRIHVQGDSVQTWVKELPVYAHYVTEAASFNLPRVPQIRLITQWNNPVTGLSILLGDATTTQFSFASTTNLVSYSKSTATTSLIANAEYAYVQSLFASSTELRNILEARTVASTKKKFTFDVATSSVVMTDATTTKQWRDFLLFEKDSEVYVLYSGSDDRKPHYYCLNYIGEKKITAQYGLHVFKAFKDQFASSTSMIPFIGQRLCRDLIRIDRLGQKVISFDFFPDSTDIILMQLEDGLYAVEADDRAWQNTQLLYPGDNIHVVQEGGKIYINDSGQYLEVFTEIASQ